MQRCPLIFTRHVNDLSDAASMNWWWNDLIRENTKAAFLVNAIDPGEDMVLVKSQYDAFYKTNLEEVLTSYKIEFIAVCGVMTNLCCETTVRTAFVRGFRPVLPIDATATYNRSLHIGTFLNLSFGFAPLMTTDEVINILRS